MAARFALKPELFARPAPVMHQAGLEGFRKRLAVHPTHHQDSAWRGRFAHDCGDQSIGGVLKIEIHRVNPSTNSRSNLLQGARGETCRRIGGSAYRRGGKRSRASGVARPRNVRTTYEKAPQLNARGNGFGPCNAGRAGAQPYRATRADTPTRRHVSPAYPPMRRHVSPAAPLLCE